jgi:hypothetical protein
MLFTFVHKDLESPIIPLALAERWPTASAANLCHHSTVRQYQGRFRWHRSTQRIRSAGIALAVGSGLLIGSSFVVKKKVGVILGYSM